MREILFRGIPKDDTTRHFFADIWKDDCEGSFVYGSLIISKDRYYICVSALCQISSCINNGMTSMIEVIPETVGQFTGLTANGKKIYEGDFVKIEHSDYAFDRMALEYRKEKGVIAYDNIGSVGLIVGRYKDENFWSDFFNVLGLTDQIESWSFEVIGNIHDNPELLKGGAEE